MNYGQRFVTLYRNRDQESKQEKERWKGKWWSEEALQIAVKRREAKSKGEKIQASECRVPKNSKKR